MLEFAQRMYLEMKGKLPLERDMKSSLKPLQRVVRYFRATLLFSLHCRVEKCYLLCFGEEQNGIEGSWKKYLKYFFLSALLIMLELLKCNEFEIANYFTSNIFFLCHCNHCGKWDYNRSCFLFHSQFPILVFRHRHTGFQ